MQTITHPLKVILEQAALWVDRQLTGSLSKENLIEFDFWRKADEQHDECVRMTMASRWVERLRDGEVGIVERESFTCWLLADTRNREEFRLASLLLRKLHNAGLGCKQNSSKIALTAATTSR